MDPALYDQSVSLFLSLQTPNCMISLYNRCIIIPEPTDPQVYDQSV